MTVAMTMTTSAGTAKAWGGEGRGRESAPRAFFFDVQGRALFGAWHGARSPRALLLMCPPLLHEHVRSYRFFSHLADRFAAAGVACLRFDYAGTGDSAGADEAFTPRRAHVDIAGAARELRRRGGEGLPLVLMGIRASALLLPGAIEAVAPDALWLWQPECDGADYLARVEAQDLSARSDPRRYPARPLPRPADADELMGFRVAGELRRHLAQVRLGAALPPSLPLAVAARAGEPTSGLAPQATYLLPEAVADWAWEIDFPRVIQARAAAGVVDALVSALPARQAEGGAARGRVAHA